MGYMVDMTKHSNLVPIVADDWPKRSGTYYGGIPYMWEVNSISIPTDFLNSNAQFGELLWYKIKVQNTIIISSELYNIFFRKTVFLMMDGITHDHEFFDINNHFYFFKSMCESHKLQLKNFQWKIRLQKASFQYMAHNYFCACNAFCMTEVHVSGFSRVFPVIKMG